MRFVYVCLGFRLRRSSEVHFHSFSVLGCPLKLCTVCDGVLEYGGLSVCECLLECDSVK